MMNITLLSSIVGTITVLSSVAVVVAVYLHRRSKRVTLWQTPVNTQSVTSSAPVSRRSSSSFLINLEKQPQTPRSRSASFSEDLTARLQNLGSGTFYRSYSPATIVPSPRSARSSLSANIRFPTVSNTTPSIPPKPMAPSITFQLRYEQTIETLFITIFQLHDCLSGKNTPGQFFLILYLLPNDDEQRQTQTTTNGVFNEPFHFPLKANDLFKRTLRLTGYTVDPTTRVRSVLGHVFLEFSSFIDEKQVDKTFATNTLSECLIQDLPIRSDHLGELVLTTCYYKDQNLIEIKLQQINHFRLEQSKTQRLLKAHFSGQTSNACHKQHWTNSSSFSLLPSPSFRIDQQLNLITPSSAISNPQDSIECHLRLHLHGSNQVHSHARWQQPLQSGVTQNLTIPLNKS